MSHEDRMQHLSVCTKRYVEEFKKGPSPEQDAAHAALTAACKAVGGYPKPSKEVDPRAVVEWAEAEIEIDHDCGASFQAGYKAALQLVANKRRGEEKPSA